MPAVYAVDLIAIRDKKIKMDRSIVKGWNVHYQTLEEVEAATRLKQQEEAQAQQDSQEPEEEEMDEEERHRAEKEAIQLIEGAYNHKTGSYSGYYGSQPFHDEEKKQQVYDILNEKPDAFSSAMSAIQADEGSGSQ